MLIEVSVKVALIIAVAWTATTLLRRESADVRHLVWLAALLSLPILAIPLPVLIETPGASFVIAQNAALTKLSGTAAPAWGRFLLWALWLAGVLVVGFRIVTAIARLAAITRRSQPTEIPSVRLSDEIATPCTWGFAKPVILLPKYATQWTDERREWAILHERAHVERRDWLWQTLARAIAALFWFHPLVWFAASRVRKEAEHAADDHVLGNGAEAAGYAAQLLDVARHVRTAFEGVAMVRTSMIEYRIRAIVDPITNRSAAGSRLKIFVGVAGLALALTVAASSTPTVHSIREKGITPPSLIRKTEPQYTAEARAAKVSGTVVVSVVIDEQGSAKNIQVRKSLDPGLDEKAVEAIRAWRFKPAEKNGKPVRVAAAIEVNFKLL
jgi:TonB family protein